MKTLPPALLLALACLPFTGCNSIEHHSECAYTAATSTAGNYDALSSTLSSACSRLQNLRKTPGGPETFLKSLDDIDALVGRAGDELKDSRESLLSHGMEQAGLLNEESAKFADADLAKKVADDASELRDRYARYEKASANLSESLALARKYAEDMRRMLELNRSAKGVDNCLGTLAKMEQALTTANAEIPASKAALQELRQHLPRPAGL